jgi:5'/3'-nucleotidase
MKEYNILITNDDGIESPGLRAAVEAVIALGTVTVVAPTYQQTGTGRGVTGDKQATLVPVDFKVNGTTVQAFHGDCSPALIVRHSMRTIFHEKKPDLLISGINYGENLGINITASGTVGAAIEGASLGIPGIAISKQTDVESHHSYTAQDWSASVYFLHKFAKSLLQNTLPPDVDMLKIDVPGDASHSTKCKFTKLAKTGYYYKEIDGHSLLQRFGDGKTIIKVDREKQVPESDIHALAIDKVVSVTPLSIDFTSRVNLSELQSRFD